MALRALAGGLPAAQRNWKRLLLIGLGLIVIGVGSIALPWVATVGATVLLGWVFVFVGVLQLLHALWAREMRGFVWQLVLGGVYLGVGILFFWKPQQMEAVLTLLLGIYFLGEGVVKLLFAFVLRRIRAWLWVAISGAVALVLGTLILFGWPGNSGEVIGILVGIDLLASGLALVLVALAARRLPRTAAGG